MLCVDITVSVWLIVPVLVSKLVVVRRLLRYVTGYYNRLWMLSNRRSSSRICAFICGTQIEIAGYHWMVQQ